MIGTRDIGPKTGKFFRGGFVPTIFLCLLFAPRAGFSQTAPKVYSKIDTTHVKIGEQIQYKIIVETDSTDTVHFPEGQTFSPLEMVEALLTDTTKNKNRITLQRIYTLTQFDSGSYAIPSQRIAINERPFFTDSFRIKVADVAVDTTKQKMFDIKPLIQVEQNNGNLWKTLLLSFLALLVAGGLVYWFFLRKKPMTDEERETLLPPYDRALLELKRLESSKYLIRDEYKKYYSELTEIVRSYLEEDAHVSALESTTAELISELEMLKDSGELQLDDETIAQFQKILQTADLVKFARSKPPTSLAEQDRKTVEEIVVKTHDALPEPTEEELSLGEEYPEGLAKKKQRQKIYWAAGIFVGALVLGMASSLAFFGVEKVKDVVFGYPTKKLLEREWVLSSYGHPPVELETPDVLVRQETTLPPDAQELVKDVQTFGYGSYVGNFAIATSSVTYKEQTDPDFEAAIGLTLKTFEDLKIRNITTKQEKFTTKSGIRGLKTYGAGSFKNPKNSQSKKAKYNILSFGGKGFMQQIVITWEDGDDYAEKIVDRILRTLDVKTQA